MLLSRQEWTERRRRHEERVAGLLGDHLTRRRGGVAHPVADFLFTYYSFRPGQLRRWHPGAGIWLQDAPPELFGPYYRTDARGHTGVDVQAILVARGSSIRWIHDLLAATAGRQPHLGCFGMHEWAMVYRQSAEELRHNQLALRLGSQGTAAVVDEIRIKCSHFDAFRFFTPAARPLNELQPTRDSQTDSEQPGCLHANMDVYRWAYKLTPLAPSELVADCFTLAREIRTLDMKASPYDLSSLDLEPIRIETPEGRAEYTRQQREFAARAAVLRQRLIDVCAGQLPEPA